MSQAGETFFTVVGCMDGRVQSVVAAFGNKKYGAKFPDTITDAGIVARISKNPDPKYFADLQKKLFVSIDKHNSKGIVVDGHAECAGNPVEDTIHIQDIQNAVEFVKVITNNRVPVVGVFVKRNTTGWIVEEI